LRGHGPVEAERGAQPRRVVGGGRGRDEQRGRVAGREAHQDEGERGDEPHERGGRGEAAEDETHARMMPAGAGKGSGGRRGAAAAAAALSALVTACVPPARPRPPGTAVVASGADLESPNPLVTVHPLSRQVQRHALLVTLARYDAALRPTPYYARRWTWSDDRRTLTLHLDPALRWHDGHPTTAHDAAFTLALARDPAVGSPRRAEVAVVERADAADDTTLVVRFAAPAPDLPAVLCELPLVPRHLLDTVPRARLRQAHFERAPVGNGPFPLRGARAGAPVDLRAQRRFRPTLGGRRARPARGRGGRRAHHQVRRPGEAGARRSRHRAHQRRAPRARPGGARAQLPGGVRRGAGVQHAAAALRRRARAPRRRPRPRPRARGRRRARGYGTRGRPGRARSTRSPSPTPAPGATLPAPTPPRRRRLAPRPRRRARRGGRPLAVELRTVGAGDNAVEQLVQADLAARGVRLAIRPQELGAFLTAARAPRKDWDVLLAGIPGDVACRSS
jgi:peptide/nickel transport system substrate-binding protein